MNFIEQYEKKWKKFKWKKWKKKLKKKILKIFFKPYFRLLAKIKMTFFKTTPKTTLVEKKVFPTSLTQKIPKNKGRRFAISDIHGCGKTFIHLVENVLELTKDDQLFILGDLIDRGEHSILLLDYILKKQQEGFEIFVLMGNHEQMLLEFYHQNELSKKNLSHNHLDELIDTNKKIKSHYATFFQQLLFYIELENCLLVHAGFDVNYEPLNGENLFTNTYSMLWVRKFKGNLYKTNKKPVVHGHVVHNLEEIKENLALAKENKTAIVPIDNGCVYVSLGKYKKYKGEVGNLCAVELNTWELFYTPYRE